MHSNINDNGVFFTLFFAIRSSGIGKTHNKRVAYLFWIVSRRRRMIFLRESIVESQQHKWDRFYYAVWNIKGMLVRLELVNRLQENNLIKMFCVRNGACWIRFDPNTCSTQVNLIIMDDARSTWNHFGCDWIFWNEFWSEYKHVSELNWMTQHGTGPPNHEFRFQSGNTNVEYQIISIPLFRHRQEAIISVFFSLFGLHWIVKCQMTYQWCDSDDFVCPESDRCCTHLSIWKCLDRFVWIASSMWNLPLALVDEIEFFRFQN